MGVWWLVQTHPHPTLPLKGREVSLILKQCTNVSRALLFAPHGDMTLGRGANARLDAASSRPRHRTLRQRHGAGGNRTHFFLLRAFKFAGQQGVGDRNDKQCE